MGRHLAQGAWRGLRWNAAAQALSQAVQWGAFLTLARSLTPEAYGTVASALVVGGAVAALGELGFAQALIQRPRLSPAHLTACLWSNGVAGLVLAAAVWAGAAGVASFFGQPALADVLRALALGVPVSCAGVLPRALLERELRFRALAGIEAAAAVGGGLALVGAALAGWGVWAMVLGQWVGTLLSASGCWAASRPRLAALPAADAWRELAAVGLPLMGTRLLGFVTSHLDAVLVGRLLGPAALGAYTLAGKLVTWPMLRISHTVLRVAFPALMRRQDDPAAFRRDYVRLVRLLAVVVLPLVALLPVLAPLGLPLVLGRQWHDVAWLTQVLCVVGALKALVCTVGTVFTGCGRADLELKLNVFGALKLPALVWLGAPWGLAGVAAALVISACLGASVQQHVANRLLGLSWRTYGGALLAPAGAALALNLAAAVGLHLVQDVPTAARLAFAVGLGLGGYVLGLVALGFRWTELPGRRDTPQAA